ncbi:MAG: tripartite tricarboxylate transporter substrate-binding protein, partial [Pseudomonadota bacterium]|nr:tripartite tricarboxylate transporter substrate-binding protein [Pseudomonadota bacterium]
MTPTTRRRFALATLAATSALALPLAAQERYPARPITLVVPQAAGGANDTIARVVGQRLSQQMGVPVVIENRPGAGGNIGTAHTAKARPDGYTLLVQADSAQVINPWLY